MGITNSGPVSETIILKDGQLVFDGREIGGGALLGVKVSVGQYIHVGCHRITKEAWDVLKKQIDQEVK